jgi:hypothetical protein
MDFKEKVTHESCRPQSVLQKGRLRRIFFVRCPPAYCNSDSLRCFSEDETDGIMIRGVKCNNSEGN